MIIDARNVSGIGGAGINNAQKNQYGFLNNVTDKDVEMLRRMVDRKELPPPTDEELEMAPMNGHTARTDTFEIRDGGIRGLKECTTPFGWGYETGYDKDRAIKNAWANSQNTMFKYIGNSGRVSDEAVVGMSRDEFGEYMKTHELDKEIDWDAVDMLASGGGLREREKYSDYAAALYVSLERRINTEFSGAERDEQLAKLGGIIDKVTDNIVRDFDGGHFSRSEVFEKLGAPLPEGKLEASVRASINSRISGYRAYANNNEDFAGIDSPEDKWLERDIGYMANALRDAYKPETSNVSNGIFWTDDEINCILDLSSAFCAGIDASGLAVCGYNDEERLGMSIAEKWLSKQQILEKYNVGDDIKDMSAKMFEAYSDNAISAKESWMSKLTAEAKQLSGDTSRFMAIDRGAVNAVIDKVKQVYNESGDAKKALLEGAAFARDEYLKKVEKTPAARHQESSSAAKFWRAIYGENGDREIIKTFGSFAEFSGSKSDDTNKKVGQYMLDALDAETNTAALIK